MKIVVNDDDDERREIEPLLGLLKSYWGCSNLVISIFDAQLIPRLEMYGMNALMFQFTAN